MKRGIALARNKEKPGLAVNITALPQVKIDADQRWKAVRAHIAKGDRANEKAEQHFISAGQHLAALKAEHTGTWAEWEVLVKEKAGIGKTRASELMQIADGTKTVEQVRERSNESSGKSHAKARQISPLISGETEGDREAHPAEQPAELVTEATTITTTTVLTKKEALAAGFNTRQANRLERFGDGISYIRGICENTEHFIVPAELNREQAGWAVEVLKIAEAQLRVFRRKVEEHAQREPEPAASTQGNEADGPNITNFGEYAFLRRPAYVA
jgi:hypothetical protein